MALMKRINTLGGQTTNSAGVQPLPGGVPLPTVIPGLPPLASPPPPSMVPPPPTLAPPSSQPTLVNGQWGFTPPPAIGQGYLTGSGGLPLSWMLSGQPSRTINPIVSIDPVHGGPTTPTQTVMPGTAAAQTAMPGTAAAQGYTPPTANTNLPATSSTPLGNLPTARSLGDLYALLPNSRKSSVPGSSWTYGS